MKNIFVIKALAFFAIVFGAVGAKGQSFSKTQDPFDGNLYSITNTGSYSTYLSKFDYHTGIATAISPTIIVKKTDPGVSAIDPVHRRFIILSNFIDGGDTIYNIDLVTGLIVNKNRISLAATYFNEVLEYNCRDTTLYTMAENRTTHRVSLSSINPVTGVQTLISPVPIPTMAGSGQSALDPVNRRFFFYGVADTLFSVDLTTGTVINKAKLSSSGTYYHPSFEYNPEDQTLYTIMGAGNNSWFGKADPVTGFVSKITPGPGKLAGYAGTFQSALDPVNKLYFCIAADSLCAVSLTTGTLVYKNKQSYSPIQYESRFLGFETPCTQKYTGLETYQLSTKTVQLFPNPFSVSTTIKLNSDCRNATLSIYNLTGGKVKQIDRLNGNEIKLERNNLPAGVYFIRLEQENSLIGFEKIIISD